MQKLFLAVCLVIGFSAASAAQDWPKWEIFGGYSSFPTVARTNTNGIHVSVAGNPTSYFGVVGEMSANFADELVDLTPVPPGGMKVNSKVILFLFGPRVTIRNFKKVDIFTHYLIGGAYARDNQRPVLPTVSDTTWAYSVGFGIDLKKWDWLAFRLVQADWVTTHFPRFDQESVNNWRLSAGLVLRLRH